MGQKVHPKIFRIGELYGWSSKWFSNRDYAKFLQQDLEMKKFIRQALKEASVADIEVERNAHSVTVVIHSGKPGVIIGRGGQGVEDLKKKIQAKFLDKKANVNINIQEVSNPNFSAELVMQMIAQDLEKRMPYRRVMKQAISRVEKTEAQGVKVMISGRLNGADIARTEKLISGSLPLHTLRADIDYSRGVARTIYGAVGIKVWIYKGEVFKKDQDQEETKKKSNSYKSKGKK